MMKTNYFKIYYNKFIFIKYNLINKKIHEIMQNINHKSERRMLS